MSAPHIKRIAILPFGMVNCHLIMQGRNCILVDTGLPGSEAKIARALRHHGLSYADIRLIVITHAHVDHAGSAAGLRQLSGAPVVAHAGDLDYYQQKKPMQFCATGWFGRLFLRTGLILQPYTAFTPDILLQGDEQLDLADYGFAGKLKPTPGHTAGSLSVQLASSDAMVGDLLASGILLGGLLRTGHAMRPPFEDDAHAVAAELQHLLDSGASKFYMGHGGPLPATEVQAHIHNLRSLPE
ncbi:MBL fold metallo-hydrolase [Undibacterium sp. Di27W]|uniref:MBL fold metallo-hydrolase n=1 Tax=Undibacterium sp. Di27W TaxID=3413036 RepID=UPI003BEF9ED9